MRTVPTSFYSALTTRILAPAQRFCGSTILSGMRGSTGPPFAKLPGDSSSRVNQRISDHDELRGKETHHGLWNHPDRLEHTHGPVPLHRRETDLAGIRRTMTAATEIQWRGGGPANGSSRWVLPIYIRAVASTPMPWEPPLHPSLRTRLPLTDVNHES